MVYVSSHRRRAHAFALPFNRRAHPKAAPAAMWLRMATDHLQQLQPLLTIKHSTTDQQAEDGNADRQQRADATAAGRG
jgi:hypothetical protein